MTILVCGGRTYRNHRHVSKILGAIDGISLVIQGGADGADACARAWAAEQGIPCRTYEAGWTAYGRAAGPIRNQRMLDEGRPDLVVAFPGARGTLDMVQRAINAGVRVIDGGHDRLPGDFAGRGEDENRHPVGHEPGTVDE